MQYCPECDAPLPSSALNIEEGVALCAACGELSRLADVAEYEQANPDALDNPPHGCTVEHRGQSVHLGASSRNWMKALGYSAFALFWNSILSIFVSLALTGIASNLGIPIPDWFPALLEDGKPQMNGKPMGVGMTAFLCLFLTPFLIIGVGMILVVVSYIWGSVNVVLDEFDSYIEVGIGFASWKRRFAAAEFKKIQLVNATFQQEGQSNQTLRFDADRTIKFGALLSEDKQLWLLSVIKLLLDPKIRSPNHESNPSLRWLQR